MLQTAVKLQTRIYFVPFMSDRRDGVSIAGKAPARDGVRVTGVQQSGDLNTLCNALDFLRKTVWRDASSNRPAQPSFSP